MKRQRRIEQARASRDTRTLEQRHKAARRGEASRALATPARRSGRYTDR